MHKMCFTKTCWAEHNNAGTFDGKGFGIAFTEGKYVSHVLSLIYAEGFIRNIGIVINVEAGEAVFAKPCSFLKLGTGSFSYKLHIAGAVSAVVWARILTYGAIIARALKTKKNATKRLRHARLKK